MDYGRKARDKASRRAAGGRALEVSLRGDGIEQLGEAMNILSGAEADLLYSRAVNHTGRKAFTQVKRSLSKEIGLPQKRLTDLGRLSFRKAQSRSLTATIRSNGRYIPLGEFKPTQVVAGTKASPWRRRQLFDHAFIFAGNRKSGQRMPNGHVFVNSRKMNPNSDRENLPVPLWGPAVPKEMLETTTATAFQEVVRVGLPDRLRHEIARMTKGVVT